MAEKGPSTYIWTKGDTGTPLGQQGSLEGLGLTWPALQPGMPPGQWHPPRWGDPGLGDSSGQQGLRSPGTERLEVTAQCSHGTARGARAKVCLLTPTHGCAWVRVGGADHWPPVRLRLQGSGQTASCVAPSATCP